MAKVPHSADFGGPSNSTPRPESSSYVAATSSAWSERPVKVPMRSSWPSGVKRTRRVWAPGMRNSIHRCGPNGWSVATAKPSFSVLVYLFLWKMTDGGRRVSDPISLRTLAESTGLSKRAIQEAINTLERRRLAVVHRSHPLAVPAYEVLRPWIR